MKVNWNNSTTDKLFNALLSLQSEDEVRNFLRDLLTPQEIVEFGNRFKVAQMLSDGLPYSEIEKQTGMSSTTIARVSKFLNGKFGGYQMVLNRLKTSEVEFSNVIKNSTSEVNGGTKYAFGTQENHHHSHADMLEGG